MKKPPIHSRAVQIAHGAGVTVRQDRFGAKLRSDLLQTRGDFIERLVPADTLKASLAFSAAAAPRIEQPLRRILALQIFGDFAAQKTARNRMFGVATQSRSATIVIYVQQ